MAILLHTLLLTIGLGCPESHPPDELTVPPGWPGPGRTATDQGTLISKAGTSLPKDEHFLCCATLFCTVEH